MLLVLISITNNQHIQPTVDPFCIHVMHSRCLHVIGIGLKFYFMIGLRHVEMLQLLDMVDVGEDTGTDF